MAGSALVKLPPPSSSSVAGKNVGTSIIGSSPEFEVGLYTMCFLVGQENNRLHLHTGTDLFELNIKCFKMAHDKVGTSFPECLDHHEAIENP